MHGLMRYTKQTLLRMHVKVIRNCVRTNGKSRLKCNRSYMGTFVRVLIISSSLCSLLTGMLLPGLMKDRYILTKFRILLTSFRIKAGKG